MWGVHLAALDPLRPTGGSNVAGWNPASAQKSPKRSQQNKLVLKGKKNQLNLPENPQKSHFLAIFAPFLLSAISTIILVEMAEMEMEIILASLPKT